MFFSIELFCYLLVLWVVRRAILLADRSGKEEKSWRRDAVATSEDRIRTGVCRLQF